MLRPLAVVVVLLPNMVLGATSIQLAEDRHQEVWPMDFSISATHWYVAYARFPSEDSVRAPAVNDLLVGVYARESGVHVATLPLAEVWVDGPKLESPLRVFTAAYRDGVVVAALSVLDGSTYLAYVDRNGIVRQHRRLDGIRIGKLTTHHEFVVGTASQQVVLFDENLDLKYHWSTPDTMVVAESAGSELIILEGVGRALEETLFGTVRWLVLEDELHERMAVPVPFSFVFHPRPKLLIWAEGITLVLHDGGVWRECRLLFSSGVFECGDPAWVGDLNDIHEALHYSALSVVRSSDDGYVVAGPKWVRDLVAPIQSIA